MTRLVKGKLCSRRGLVVSGYYWHYVADEVYEGDSNKVGAEVLVADPVGAGLLRWRHQYVRRRKLKRFVKRSIEGTAHRVYLVHPLYHSLYFFGSHQTHGEVYAPDDQHASSVSTSPVISPVSRPLLASMWRASSAPPKVPSIQPAVDAIT